MENLLKVMVGPSPHWFPLKSGQIKFQKSRPARPVWRMLANREPQRLLPTRIFPQEPTASEIQETILGLTPEGGWGGQTVVVPENLEKLCPGLQATLMRLGAVVMRPRHGFAAGSRAGRHWEDFIRDIACHLSLMRESMGSCEEIAAACGHPLGIMTVAMDRRDDDRGFYRVAKGIAEEITRRRGRDPKEGFDQRMNESAFAPPNTTDRVAPPEDVLATVLEKTEPNFGYSLTEFGGALRHLALSLQEIREAGPGDHPSLLHDLGTWTVGYHFDQCRLGHPHQFSNLVFRDKILRCTISKAVKEALKGPIAVGARSLLGLSSRVAVRYPASCEGVSLRGVPAHHHLERMFAERLGPACEVVIDPCLRPVRTPFTSSSNIPDFPNWFHIGRLRSRTPFSPSGSFETVTERQPRNEEGLLVAWILLPHTLQLQRPPGDAAQAEAMTDLVNERIARAGKGVTCTIGPWRPLGEMMGIGTA